MKSYSYNINVFKKYIIPNKVSNIIKTLLYYRADEITLIILPAVAFYVCKYMSLTCTMHGLVNVEIII